jgi:hypothetical protein
MAPRWNRYIKGTAGFREADVRSAVTLRQVRHGFAPDLIIKFSPSHLHRSAPSAYAWMSGRGDPVMAELFYGLLVTGGAFVVALALGLYIEGRWFPIPRQQRPSGSAATRESRRKPGAARRRNSQRHKSPNTGR